MRIRFQMMMFPNQLGTAISSLSFFGKVFLLRMISFNGLVMMMMFIMMMREKVGKSFY